ncbi:MAG: hypothetical protein LBM00_11705 [Deltaproteobacteria bacterium]|nr:hypothetical protein [Deltaproteobacteria bacterium]
MAKFQAWILFKTGFFGRAALKLRGLAQRSEPSKKLLYRECLAWMLNGHGEIATETSRRALQKFPEDPEILRSFIHLHKDILYVRAGVKILLKTEILRNAILAAELLRNNASGDEAADILLAFAKRHPEHADLIGDYILWNLNCRVKAKAAFALALAHQPSRALRLKSAMSAPMTPKNQTDLDLTRREILADLQAIAQEPLLRADASTYIETFSHISLNTSYSFLDNLYPLVFHGEADVEIMQARAKAFYHSFPELKFTAPHLLAENSVTHKKIRFGFFTEFIHTDVWKFWGPMLIFLPRDIFTVVLFAPAGLPVYHRNFMRKLCDEFIEYPYLQPTAMIPVAKGHGHSSFPITRDILASADLDILYSNLIGQSPLHQYLAYARLAKLQMVDGGRLTTTGMPEIDYYLLNEGNFTGDPKTYFTERLAFTEGQTPFFKKMMDEQAGFPAYPLTREMLGWPDRANIYLGMQELANRHPEMDPLFARILKVDPKALLVLTNRVGGSQLWTDLIAHLENLGITNAAQRLLLAPHCNMMPPGFTRALVNLADVCLSYRRYGGGTTFNQLLAYGIPQIIWPNESYVGYICAGVYTQIGLDELLVDNADDYVSGNIKLAVSKKYRNEVQRVFREKTKTFYERLHRYDYSGSLASFFQQAAARARSGLLPAHWHRGHFYEKLTAENLKNFAEQSKYVRGINHAN